jgi:hypothetical protein
VKVGITGHQRLKDNAAWEWVKPELDNILVHLPKPVIGISSLAVGADQLFAQSILQHGGSLNVVIPFEDYGSRFEQDQDRKRYLELLNMASQINVLPRSGSDEESYYKAGKHVSDISDLLIAIWDCKPAAGLGGTGDIVKYARNLGKRIIHVNPVDQTVTQIN